MAVINSSHYRGKKIISSRVGILHHIGKLPRLSGDPKLISFGTWASDTTKLKGEKYEGKSSGCHSNIFDSFMGTVGETVERYCAAFYDLSKMVKASYHGLSEKAIHPSEFALFHSEQHKLFREKGYKVHPFDEETELYWDACHDIANNKEIYCPSAFIYMPWTIEQKWITTGTSTGLAAHVNWHKALLTALFEIIERDSFVITWYQKIIAPKIIIDKDIHAHLSKNFPSNYEWHFFNITYDLEMPTIFGICYGESEFGKFIAVGTATRGTLGGALRKVIQEIGQSVSYFRYLYGEKKEWIPDEFHKLRDFDEHAIFYNKRPDLRHVFDDWRNAIPCLKIDFNEREEDNAQGIIKQILEILKKKGYNALVKDITTPDANQAGFYSLRVVVPQLLPLGGAYHFYFLGGKRLYEVPSAMGYKSHSYDNLNKFPHPFP